ncbi:hypothetical protein DFH07DRAFT_961093 [Mycena maculata]|uniref:FAD/NAD(P)-binding domain-containing protein n=1 Tax=Mycena maculata TaxID=230809 RepID=A0AAD7IXE4_9AGAR|nr:hypothetical protein DFH07DRAFT_961093 [Mycena maculata]
MPSQSKNVVIVGGSPSGGVALLKSLLPKLPTARITLINPLPYAVALPTLPRMTVSDSNDLFETALIPYDKLFQERERSAFVQDTVVGVQLNKTGGGVVIPKDGQHPVDYDVLALAPGSIWEGPLEIPQDSGAVAAFANSSRASFNKAQKIVLVEGGAGAQIKDIWSVKEVTIVHGRAFALGASTYIILNDYVDEIPPPGPVAVKTRKGNDIDADLVVPTRGPRPRTEFIAKSLGPATLDEKKQSRSSPHLSCSIIRTYSR